VWIYNKAQLEEIANIKLPDLTTKVRKAKIVEGTARNMGISIVD
jgi:ribosomal protein L11